MQETLASAKSSTIQQRVSATLVIISMAHLVLEFANNYLPVAYPLLMPALGLSFTQVGLIALVSSTVMSLTQPVFGFFSDRLGAAPIVAISILVIGFAMGAVGLAPSYAALLVLVAIGGLSSAAFHPPAVVMAAAHSGERRGFGLSVFSVGGNIGAALSPLWIAIAIRWLGLPGTVTILPFTVMFAAIFYTRMRTVDTSSSRTTKSASTANVGAKGFLVGMILVVAAMMFRSWYHMTLMTYLPVWIEATGGTLAAGGRILFVFLFSTSLGSVIGGVSGDRIGHLNVLILAMASLPPIHALFMNSTGNMQVAAILLSGIAVGCTFPNSIVLVLEAWPQQAGIATGLLMGLGWWPGGIGASLTGLLADRYTLTYAINTLTYIPLIGLLCLMVYRILAHKRV